MGDSIRCWSSKALCLVPLPVGVSSIAGVIDPCAISVLAGVVTLAYEDSELIAVCPPAVPGDDILPAPAGIATLLWLNVTDDASCSLMVSLSKLNVEPTADNL